MIYLKIYVGGIILWLVIFAICYRKVVSLETRKDEFLEIKELLQDIAVEYSLFWPWRCVGFPLFMLCTGRWKKLND